MVVVIDATSAGACADMLREAGETVYEIGVIAERGEGASVTVV
jgi:phosphoribosylformylglycinamidine cyclo-ligase